MWAFFHQNVRKTFLSSDWLGGKEVDYFYADIDDYDEDDDVTMVMTMMLKMINVIIILQCL